METTCYHHKCDAQLTLLSRETRQEVDSHILQNGLHQTTGTFNMCNRSQESMSSSILRVLRLSKAGSKTACSFF